MTTYYIFRFKGSMSPLKRQVGEWLDSVLVERMSSETSAKHGPVEFLECKVKREREVPTYYQGKVISSSPIVSVTAINMIKLNLIFAGLADAEIIRKFCKAFEMAGLHLYKVAFDLSRTRVGEDVSGFGPEIVGVTGIRVSGDSHFERVGRTLETSREWFNISKAATSILESVTFRLDIERLPVLVTLRRDGSIAFGPKIASKTKLAVFQWFAGLNVLQSTTSVIQS